MAAYGVATRRDYFFAFVRKHGAVGFLAGSLSALGYLAFLAAAQRLPLGPILALRETSVIFGTLIGAFVLHEAFALRRIMASTLVLAGVAALALVR